MIERLQRRLGLKVPFIEVFSNDAGLGELVGDTDQDEVARSEG